MMDDDEVASSNGPPSGEPIMGGTSEGNFLEDSISMLERTSMKLYPVVKEVIKRLIDETEQPQT